MKMQLFKRIISMFLVLCMVLAYVPAANATNELSVTWKETDQKITAERDDRLIKKDGAEDRDPSEVVRVSIVLEEPSTVGAGYATMGIASNPSAMAYRDDLLAIQKRMEKTISTQALGGKPLDVVWNMTLVGNIISAWVPYGSLEKIADINGIKAVAMEAQYEPAVTERNENAVPNAYASSSMIGSGSLWNSGYTGAGTRIAIVDTGTDIKHQSMDNGAYLYALSQNAAAKGKSVSAYKTSLNLMNESTISSVLSKLHASQRMSGVTAADLYLNEKIPFGFNYVDGTLNIEHMLDQQGEHGSHVAGIATANRFIPQADGTYADARSAVMMLGVAPDAQLITMKVFGQTSPYDSDYMAAIEDAIILDCDAVNLSLGTTMPGSPYTDVYANLMEMLKETDTVVTISAGNAANWAVASTFGYLYSDDVSFDMVGAPGSYENAFTVASVDNDGVMGNYFSVGDKMIFYSESIDYGNTPMVTLDTSTGMTGTEYDYIFLDGIGEEGEYAGINVTGKIVLVSRGTLNFAAKANNALSRGAAAVIIYNNESGMHGMDLTGLSYAAPVIAITQADAAAIRAVSENKGSYYTGKMTVHGKMIVSNSGSEYYHMSNFSSWGIPSSLTLKPEITAPGGEIYSLWGSNASTGGGTDMYETMSGTSMAAPQVTGMSALLAQYYRENGLDVKTDLSPRHLAQSLLMSTAQPLYEEASGGNYYSLLNQGAGLARVDYAANAESYIIVSGQDDGKVKAELGDDPERTGVYEFDFTITNMTDSVQHYTLDADLFRQDVFEYQSGSDVWLMDTWTTDLDGEAYFTSSCLGSGADGSYDMNGDGSTNAADADYLLEYVVGNQPKLYANGDISDDGNINSYDAHLLLASLGGEILTVPANKTATVHVNLVLSASAKSELDKETPNGTYVEAFVYAKPVPDAEGKIGTTHSIPVLAFYGDWSEPSMFDRGTLIELTSMTSNTAPYLYQSIGPYGNALAIDYGDGIEYYYGGNPILDDDTYLPERNAFNSEDASRLTEQGFTLIRGAGSARIQITNASNGEVYFERILGELYPAYYDPSYGQWSNSIQYEKLNWSGTNSAGKPLPEGTTVNVSLTAVPHYYRQANGSYSFDDLGAGSTMTTTLTIDNTAPVATNIDLSRLDDSKLTVKAKDNAYVSAVALLNTAGTKFLCVQSPNQTVKNKEVTVELDLDDIYGNNFLVAVFDYANNMTTYQVELNLGLPERQYFTAIDYNSMNYIGMDKSGQTSVIAETGQPAPVRAAEYVGGYVFSITEDNVLYVANDEDLSCTQCICKLDPDNDLLITSVNDMAHNHADDNLYVMYYSSYNGEEKPYLATINMNEGSIDEICELPVDVNTMAIDTAGNFYSAGYDSSTLYTYTLAQVTGSNPSMTYVGEMGYYGTTQLSSMAWDHNEGKLYWTFPNTLLEINPKTSEPKLLGYQNNLLVGLYVTPTTDEGRFDPVDKVTSVELNHANSRVLLNESMKLEASVWPWYTSNKSIKWSTSDASVATVNANGIVTGISNGTCVITATSDLDPTKTASCVIEVFSADKTLNAIICDENSEIWMSEFTTSRLPAYTKLSAVDIGSELACATIGQDGNIYAASLNWTNGYSDLYRLESNTFEATKIGASTDFYLDLAPAPGAPGNSLMAVYGGNILNVDASTGDYYNWYNMFSNNLVGLAYIGTEPYTDYGFNTEIDWYFIIDQVGTVYLMGFLEQDGRYYYLEHDQLAPGGVYTTIDFEMDTSYFGSAYFDGEMLYFSAYKESEDMVTLMAVDVIGGNRASYVLGNFEKTVWPVAGLMELGKFENHIEILSNSDGLATTAVPQMAEPQTEFHTIRGDIPSGSLHHSVEPMSRSDAKDDLVYVYVTLPYDGTNADMTVSFDTKMLELTGVDGSATAFAWNGNNGKIRLSLAEASSITPEATVARLTFRPIGEGQTTVSIVTNGLGAEGCGHEEFVTVQLKEHTHHFTSVVTEPTCTEQGYTTHTCSCGYFYVDSYVSPLGHNWDDGVVTREPTETTEGERLYTCKRCNDTKRESIPAKNHTHSYTSVVTAPTCTEHGYTTHTCSCGDRYTDSYTDPLGHDWDGTDCTRCDEVWEMPFTDVPTNKHYYYPVIWAVQNGITNGTTETTFEPNAPCTRWQIVTFLWRAAGCPEPESMEHNFTDVNPKKVYYKAMLWAVENGITNGTTATTFSPNDTCTRWQIVTFLWRYAGCPEPKSTEHNFTDVNPKKVYFKAMLWAVEEGITNGTTATTFAPNNPCTRGQIVTFLYRYMVE